MTVIDQQACADLVQAIADRIARERPTLAGDASIADLIAHVRTASRAAERTLRTALTSLHPTIGWTGEEASPTGGDYWLYDPIDGAYHYLQGLPLWSSSLVLVRGDRPVFSIVYDAALGEVFVAGDGQGTTCNGEPIRVSPKANLTAAVIGTTVPPLAQVGAPEQEEALALLGTVSRAVFVVRLMAATSLQLAYVAAGRLDAYCETGRDAADWLAGSLLVRGAGGVVSDLRGSPFGWSGDGILAGNASLHRALLPIINDERSATPTKQKAMQAGLNRPGLTEAGFPQSRRFPIWVFALA